MAMDRLDLLGVELVRGGIVEDQDPIPLVNQGFGLAVEGLRIGFEAVEQSGGGVMGRGISCRGLAAGGLAATGCLGRSDQEVDVGGVMALGMAHDAIVGPIAGGRNLY